MCPGTVAADRGGCVVTARLRRRMGSPRSSPWPEEPSRSPGRSRAAAPVSITAERPRSVSPGVGAAFPLSPVAAYRTAVEVAAHDHLRCGSRPTWSSAGRRERPHSALAVTRVAALARHPGVVGIKIADELGYHDGLDSAAKIRRFLSDTARALHAAAPHKLILVDMVVPQLGCLPGPQQAAPAAAACAATADSHYPGLALSEIDSYLRMHAIDVLDLSTGLLSDSTYASWGTTSDAAQTAAWQEVSRRGWPRLVQLQARKALAHPGSYRAAPAEAADDVRLFVAIPLAHGARAVDIWTWHQEYDVRCTS